MVVFLYRDTDKYRKPFISLFKELIVKLKENKNVSLLLCNLSKNEIEMKLGFEVKVSPAVSFYRNKIKGIPIHFSGTKMSAESIIEFIMENTTFDWE